jgi:hypothetical protein
MSPQVPLSSDSFLDFPCFWPSWWFWEVLVRHFVDCPSLEFLWFFLMLILRLWGLQRKTVRVTRCSHCIMEQGTLSTWLFSGCWAWSLGCIGFIRSLHYRTTPLSSFCAVLFGRRSLYADRMWRVGSKALLSGGQSFCINYIRFFCMKVISSNPFV